MDPEVSNDQTPSDDFTTFEAELEGRAQAPATEAVSDSQEESGVAPEATKKTPDSHEEEPKLSAKAQARIDKITREKYELQRQLDEARKAKPAAEKTDSAPAAEATTKTKMPNPHDYDGTPGKTWEDYERDKGEAIIAIAEEKALARYKSEREAEKQQEAKASAETQWDKQQDEARAIHSDYNEIVNDDTTIDQDVYVAIRQHPKAGELLYAWGKLTEEEKLRIMAIDNPHLKAYETLKLAESIKGTQEKTETTKTPVSKASKPPSKVAGAAAQTNMEDTDDFLAFAAAEDSKRKKGR